MSERAEFTKQLNLAVLDKTQWYNSTELPKLLSSYNLLHTCAKNIYDLLLKRSLITADPYRDTEKITKIVAPRNDAFSEMDAGVTIGARLSQYEGMLAFIATHFKFTIDNLTLQKIKRLTELNSSFNWTDMSANSSEANTRGLATLINGSRKNLEVITSSLLDSSLSKSSQALGEINKILKELTAFKREEYKLKVRTEACGNAAFNFDACTNQNEELEAIKKVIPTLPEKLPVYTELIAEVCAEDLAGNKDSLQSIALKRLTIKIAKKPKKQVTVDAKAILIDSVTALSVLSPIYNDVTEKLINNKEILDNAKQSFIDKIKKALRRALNMKEPQVIYRFVIENKEQDTRISRDVDINLFIANISKKAGLLAALGNREGAEYKKIASSQEEIIGQFLDKQLTENREILTLLTAADDYFKKNVKSSLRQRVRGLKMDLVTINEALAKSNKKKGEYLDTIESLKLKKPLPQ